jgi:hypothetical protein
MSGSRVMVSVPAFTVGDVVDDREGWHVRPTPDGPDKA